MNMHPFGWVFLIGATTVSFFVLSILALSGQGLPATAILAFAAPCFFCIAAWAAFTVEANTARAALRRLWSMR
jgi:hypothetical protein